MAPLTVKRVVLPAALDGIFALAQPLQEHPWMFDLGEFIRTQQARKLRLPW
jgi:hypothetical protein